MKVLEMLTAWLLRRAAHADRRYLIAYSGGMDSHVLLHAMATLQNTYTARLVVLHVDHALQDDSSEWSTHCRTTAERLDVEYHGHRLDAAASNGEGPEDRARSARYAWFSKMVGPGDVLMMAHHRGDQAETLLYNLFRGTGLRGLTAMPAERAFSCGTLARPLLSLPRKSLREYAIAHQCDWIEDPSNDWLEFDRNYLRHQVLPTVQRRWPAVEVSIERAAANVLDALKILDRVAASTLDDAVKPDSWNPLSDAPVLDSRVLAQLSMEEVLNLVRFWIVSAGFALPARRRLERLHTDLIRPKQAMSGQFSWGRAEIRRYRYALYLHSALPEISVQAQPWDLAAPLSMGPLCLTGNLVIGKGLATRFFREKQVTVDWHTGDRTIRSAPDACRKSLRKVFQESGIPPWLRRILPRIILDGELVCVPGVVESDHFIAARDEEGISFELSAHPPGRDAEWM